jgi:hypothetical protein
MDKLSKFDKLKIFTEYPPENQIELYDPNIAIYLKLEKDKECQHNQREERFI